MITKPVKVITIGTNKENKITIGGKNRFVLIAGPCVIESEEMVMKIADEISEICKKLGLQYIFKASFDKANRSSIHSFRGSGLDDGLKILKKVKDQFKLPIVTDVHETWQCKRVAEVVDMLQIPAFLCRQTDLLIAAAATGLPVNIKKGQFLAPWDMKNIVIKMEESGNSNILLCERGSTFGYNNMVVDMRSLLEMRKFGYPIVFDVTHSVQKPGGLGTATSGDREYVYPLIRAGLAVGVDAIFAEVHPDPDNAKSDGPNMIRLDDLENILKVAIKIDDIAKTE
jgi:2-dehydro-3-deoxyphosphooctonate aldolase (KDO 8-P synthase)